jgi:PAS domain S-box-containing protein
MGPSAPDRNNARDCAARGDLDACLSARLLDAVGEAVIATDPRGKVVYWNEAAKRLYGWSAEEVMGRPITEVTPSEELLDRAEEIMSELQAGRSWSGEFLVRRKDGSTFPATVTDTPVHDEGGNLVAIVGVSRDVTEYKRAEKALKESEQRFASSFRDAAIGMALVGLDGRWLQVNPAMCRIVGYPEEELLDKTFQDVTHPDDLDADLEHVRRMLAGEIDTYGMEKRYVHREGHVVWGLLGASLVRDDEGEPLYFIAQIQDITGRKRAEGERLRLAEHVRRLLESTDEGIYGIDLQGTCTFANRAAARMLGYEPEELLGRHVHETIHHTRADGSPYPDEECPIYRAFREVRGVRVEGEVLWRSDGTALPVEYSSYPVVEGGRLEGAIVTFVDATERKRAQEDRERLLARGWKARAEAEERKRISRELHDRVAHAMAVAHQSLELHEALKQRDPETAGAKMRLAKAMTKEAMILTRDLSSKLRSAEAQEGLHAALSSLLEATVPPGTERTVSVEGDEAFVPPHVREQLFVILREGVRNAVSHSGAGRIDVRVRISPEEVAGRVEDDGRGFVEGVGGAHGGIRSMEERAELVGGTFELSPGAGVGTSIEVRLPLERGPDSET